MHKGGRGWKTGLLPELAWLTQPLEPSNTEVASVLGSGPSLPGTQCRRKGAPSLSPAPLGSVLTAVSRTVTHRCGQGEGTLLWGATLPRSEFRSPSQAQASDFLLNTSPRARLFPLCCWGQGHHLVPMWALLQEAGQAGGLAEVGTVCLLREQRQPSSGQHSSVQATTAQLAIRAQQRAGQDELGVGTTCRNLTR